MSLDQTTETAVASTHDDLVGLFAAELAAEDAPVAPAKSTPSATSATDQGLALDAEAPETTAPDEGVEAETSDEPDSAAETPSATSAINAPTGMTEADRALFAQLPPEQQQWLTQREQQRTADYTRKTQEVAEQARAAKAERQALGTQLEQYNAFLSTITNQKLQPPDPAMQQTDPLGYQDAMAEFVQAKHRQDQAITEQNNVQAQHKRMQEQQYNEFVTTEHAKLLEIMPEYKDPKTGPTLRKAVVAYAHEHGFGELLANASAREISVLTKAMRYDAAQKAKATATVVPPAVMKSSRPGPARAPGQRSGMSNAVSTLTANPSRASLAAAYMAEINSER